MSKGQKIAYIRVSSIGQKTDRQIEKLKGENIDRTFEEKVSAKNVERPELQNMISFAREGDTIVVCSMDRLARSLQDLIKLVKDFNSRGIKVQFLKENLTFTGEDNAMSNLLMGILGSIGVFERDLIAERRQAGIDLAKKQGKYTGRKPALSPQQVDQLRERVKNGEMKSKIAKDYGIRRETVYRYLKK